jgi:hypothetical protein
MLLSTYNPESQAYCPACKKLVDCWNTQGNLAFYPRYMQFRHDECGTEWRMFLDEDRDSEIISPNHRS